MTIHFYNLDQKSQSSRTELFRELSHNGIFNESWIPNSCVNSYVVCEVFIFMLGSSSLSNVPKSSDI